MKKNLLSKLTFIECTEEQAQLLVDFEKAIATLKLYSTPLDLAGALKEISNHTYYFIKLDKKIVGTAAYSVREDGSCYISGMAVLPEYRGQGIARAAMEFLLKECGDIWRINLVTHPKNFRSIPLYESFGFVTELRIENFYGDGEPRIIMAKNNTPAEELRILPCSTDIEWQAAKTYRQKYFFDKVPTDDPYTWTFSHKAHRHFVLYNSINIIGYAHIQRWSKHRAAMRIIVIEETRRGYGFGKWFMRKIEARLKNEKISILHTESSPSTLNFYTALGYTPMRFDDPDGYDSGVDDIAVGKKL